MTSFERLLRCGLVLLASAAVTRSACSETLQSPGGVVRCEIAASRRLAATLSLNGKQVADASGITVRVGGRDLGERPTVASVAGPKEVSETYPQWGFHAVATNHYHEYVVELQSHDGQPWSMEVRLYDDAFAYRLRVPLEGRHRLDGDFAAWRFPADAEIWQQTAHNRPYEGEYLRSRVGDLDPGHRMMAPATMVLPGGGYAMITEANLVRYSDRALEVTADGQFQHVFHDDSNGWDHEGELVTPWRAVLLTETLNQLVNSDAVGNLCPPPNESVADAEWIAPGRCSWHWLITFHAKLQDQRKWIDGASQLGWEYHLVDDGWRGWNGGGQAAWDALAELVDYARERDVRLWAWVDSKFVFDQAERRAYFQKARDLGLVGLKIDFPHPANREWVDWYEATLADAADARLMINFHGPVKPTGRQRTWPNELTREAIRGREQGKLPASHDTALPFVRFVQGSADYTPTLLDPGKLNGSTLTHEMAMAVVFSSPLLCMGDNPARYLESQAVDILKALPAKWDETIVLPGSEVGSLAAFARRRGDQWFIGVINDDAGDLEIATDFLSEGQYTRVELGDHPDDNAKLVRREGELTAGEPLTVRLADDGGYLAWLRPVGE